MGDVIRLKAVKRRRAEGRTLCDSGFHKWQLVTERRFDVREGKLVSLERCKRCGHERTRLT